MSARDTLVARLREALDRPQAARKLWETMSRGRANRASSLEALQVDVGKMKAANRAVKLSAMADTSLVARFAGNVRENGGKVVFANDGDEAVQYAVDLAKRTGSKLIAKSKSLTSEEIELNQALEKDGMRCVETDLGELIVQLEGGRPVHLVYPAADRSIEDIAKTFSREFRHEIPPDPEAILREVRAHLRTTFLEADMGISGSNIGIAETGTILIETNEGNARLVTSLPKTHLVIMGLEKIVASWSDAAKLVQAHALSASGQKTTVYVTALSQRLPLAGSSEGRELHVIILDNGRSKMAKDPSFSDALNCIRCGACMNVCPTYGVAGGRVFGYIYPGPIGIPWTSNVHGLDKATFAHLCISCGLCKEVCPVDIDIPFMIAKVKEQDIKQNGQLPANKTFVSSESMAEIASATAPLSNWLLRRGAARYLLEKFAGVDRRRTLPRFGRTRLRDSLGPNASSPRGESGNVVFFPDLYADYNDTDLGKKAVMLLTKLGYHVEVPDLRWSGMPYISYGELDKARDVAQHNLDALSRYVREGYKIVSTEPTAIYMLHDIYPKLVPGTLSRQAAAGSVTFFEFISPRLDQLGLKASRQIGGKVGFHLPCHERAMASGLHAIDFLRKAGYEVMLVETGTCCGMGGTFGMKQGVLGYDLSMAVGNPLFRAFEQSSCTLIATESSVCATQIHDGTSLEVVHPLHLVE